MDAIRTLTGNFIATEVDDEVLIVDLDGGELFSLAGTARAVWRAIDGKRSEEDICAMMGEAHDGDAETIARDVSALLADLERAAMIERVAGNG